MERILIIGLGLAASAVACVLGYFKFLEKQWFEAGYIVFIGVICLFTAIYIIKSFNKWMMDEDNPSDTSNIGKEGSIVMRLRKKEVNAAIPYWLCFYMSSIISAYCSDQFPIKWLSYPVAFVFMLAGIVCVVAVDYLSQEYFAADPEGFERIEGVETVPILGGIISPSRKKTAWTDVGAVERRDIRDRQDESDLGSALSRCTLALLHHDGQVLQSLDSPLKPLHLYQRFLDSLPAWTGLTVQDPHPVHRAADSRKPMQLRDWGICAFFAIIMVPGAILIRMGLPGVYHALSTTNWPTVPGLVTQSGASTGTSQSSSTEGSGATQSKGLVFSYQVQGRTYTTDQLYFGQLRSDDKKDAELNRLRYPVGAQVAISYNPKDPSMAVVTPGFHMDVLVLPGAGLGWGLVWFTFLLLILSSNGVLREDLAILVFGVILLLGGAALLVPGLTDLQRGRDSLSWPTTPGVMLAEQRNGIAKTVAGSDEDYTFGTQLIYRYSVGEKKYYSKVIRFGRFSSDYFSSDESKAKGYQGGGEVKVFYNPKDPWIAALGRGADSQVYLLPGGGAAIVLFGLAAIWKVLCAKKR